MTERNESRTDGDFNPQGNSLRISSDLIGKTLPVAFNTPAENNAEGNLKCGLCFQGGFEGDRGTPCILFIFQDGVVKPFYFSAVGFTLCRNVSCGLLKIRQMKERKNVRLP